MRKNRSNKPFGTILSSFQVLLGTLANFNFFLPIWLIFFLNRRIFKRLGGTIFLAERVGGPLLFLTYDPLCTRSVI
jgi:hypothetical protein